MLTKFESKSHRVKGEAELTETFHLICQHLTSEEIRSV